VISPILRYSDAPAALDWLVRGLGFEKLTDHRTPEGSVAHADLRFGSSAIGVSSTGASPPDSPWAQVRHGIYLRVGDPDAVHARAVDAGSEIVAPLTDQDYGAREFSLRDPGGHLWAIGTYDLGAHAGEPSLWPETRYPDTAAAVSWLQRALGFRQSFQVTDEHGAPRHVELRLASAVYMLAASTAGDGLRQFLNLKVDDVDAVFGSATSAGATLLRAPHDTPYGARACGVRDAEGFVWWISNYTPAP
jgi:uncharacterized glyoxalase superfamily protein PhnB